MYYGEFENRKLVSTVPNDKLSGTWIEEKVTSFAY